MDNDQSKPHQRKTVRKPSRNKIIETARDHFLANGFAGTSLSAIALEVDGSKETLWRHFPSKEVLFQSVVVAITGDWRADIEKALRAALKDAHPHAYYYAAISRILNQHYLGRGLRMLAGEQERFPLTGSVIANNLTDPTIRGLRILDARFGNRVSTDLTSNVGRMIAIAVLPSLELFWPECREELALGTAVYTKTGHSALGQ